MKKVVALAILILSLFLFPSCTNSNENKPARLREITGTISSVTLDDDKDIIINKNEITEEVRYYSYEFEDVVIGLFAVLDSSGNIRVLINTCASCGGAPYAYFVQVDDKIQCQNCGSLFPIDSLGDLESSGCNPIGINDIIDNGSTLKISHLELEEYKDLFLNWQGPKA